MAGVFQARYPGRCAACEERIHEGDDVRYSDDQIVHASCDDVKPERPTLPPCDRCFMVPAANGVCGCDE